MSEKRFNPSTFDSKHEVWDLLEKQAIIIEDLEKENEQLRQTIKEMQQDEQLYANERVKLNKEAKEVLNFKTLGGDY